MSPRDPDEALADNAEGREAWLELVRREGERFDDEDFYPYDAQREEGHADE